MRIYLNYIDFYNERKTKGWFLLGKTFFKRQNIKKKVPPANMVFNIFLLHKESSIAFIMNDIRPTKKKR